MSVSPQLFALTPGQTVGLEARATTADGRRVGVHWASLSQTLSVDRDGRVTAIAPGRGWIEARPATDSTKLERSEVWVVAPDTSSQPFIAAFLDAVSGTPLVRATGFAGRDSVRLTLSYVLGIKAVTRGAPELLLEVRRPGASAALLAITVPIHLRGQGAVAHVTVPLSATDSTGARRLPPGAYDFFVLLPLVDGRLLGSETGYRFTL